MSVSETINKLKSSWCCGYIEDVKIDFEELEELEAQTQKRSWASGEEFDFSDLVPAKIDDIENYKGKFGKVKYYFNYLTDKDNAKKISCLAIPGFLCLMFVINFLVPSKNISEKERTFFVIKEDKSIDTKLLQFLNNDLISVTFEVFQSSPKTIFDKLILKSFNNIFIIKLLK